MWPFGALKRAVKRSVIVMQARPVNVNPSGNAREDRRCGRIARLRQAIIDGDKRPEVFEELERLERRR